jgi:hypothetical protein
MAKTMEDDGENEYLVTDDNGCATDSAVFGEWIKDVANPGSLISHFDAFKFPSSNSIRFQCNVRVCFGKCQPVNCNGVDVMGRRRRQISYTDVEDEDPEIFETVFTGQFREEVTVESNAILTLETTGRFVDPNDGNCALQSFKATQGSSRIL